MGEDWQLLDVELTGRAAPTPEKRRTLRPGDVVKLVFELPRSVRVGDSMSRGGYASRGERLKVRVVMLSLDRYVGEILDTPRVVGGVERGKHIVFGPENVEGILVG